MFHIRGPDYCPMNEVAKRLGMSVTKRMKAYAKKMALDRKRRHDRANSKEQRIARSMARRRRQMESTYRRGVSALMKKKLGLATSMKHRSEEAGPKLLEGVECEDDKNGGESVEEESDDESLNRGEVQITKFQKIVAAPKVNRLLVVLDINETLLFQNEETLTFRNHLKSFIDALLDSGVHIGTWTGLC